MALERRLYASTVPAFERWAFDRIVKATGDKVSPPAVLTYPIKDLDSDILEPDGIHWDFWEGTLERLVNLNHGPPIGTGEVEYKSMPQLNAAGQPDESLPRIDLPIGTATFFDSAAEAARHTLRAFDEVGQLVGVYKADDCARIAEQVYPLVPDIYSSVSMEFRPRGGAGVGFDWLEHNQRTGRRGRHFYSTDALGWAAACKRPVNRIAGYSPTDHDMAIAEKAFRVFEWPGTDEFVRKSLDPIIGLLKHNPTNRVTSRGASMPATKPAPNGRVKKADEYQGDPNALPAAGPAPTPESEAAPAGPDMKPTPAALFQLAQGIEDACAMAEQMGESGEHPQGLKDLAKLCEQGRALSAKAKSAGEKVASSQGGEEAATDDESEPEPVETDDDGGIVSKAFTGQYRPARAVFKATPYTAAHLKKAKAAVPPGQTLIDSAELANLRTLAEAFLEGQ